MAEPLKNMYNPEFFETICPVFREHIPGFDCKRFVHLVFDNRWPDLELKDRVRHITRALRHFLPDDFLVSSKMVVDLSNAFRKKSVSNNFALIFLPDYIEVYGLGHPAQSFCALEEITQLISAEFAIRPFLGKYPELAMKQMLKWSKHVSPAVRRLSSEGCRPRLPWAPVIPFLTRKPEQIFPILENLISDKSAFVQRSVANNLNDIAREFPDRVLAFCKKWQRNKSDETQWILRHGCRNLLKKGNREALLLHGFNPDGKGVVRALSLHSKKIRIGDVLDFNFQFSSLEKHFSTFRLEYAIDYITSRGKTSKKIFQIAEKQLGAGGAVRIQRRQTFKDMTTRKHHRGKHILTILANGRKMAAAEFVVC